MIAASNAAPNLNTFSLEDPAVFNDVRLRGSPMFIDQLANMTSVAPLGAECLPPIKWAAELFGTAGAINISCLNGTGLFAHHPLSITAGWRLSIWRILR